MNSEQDNQQDNEQNDQSDAPAERITRDSIGQNRSPEDRSQQDRSQQDRRQESALTILQHERGYRFGLDALLLATDLPDFDPPEGQKPVIAELGAAQGVVSLCVARQYPEAAVIAVERQEALFGLLEQNIEVNQLGERVQALKADIREFAGGSSGPQRVLAAHSVDLVLCNPPYFRAGERRPSANAERAAARHELHGGLADFVDAARYVLKQRGRLKIILPPIRMADLLQSIESTDLDVESLRFFHSRADADAYLVESVLRRGGSPDLKVRPPLYIYKNADDYSDEVQRRVDAAASPAASFAASRDS
jgi:tRNA1Val (adenine37-N6)-methyltransferase